jgi:hypothetical protein
VFGESFNQPLASVPLPEGLLSLEFGAKYDFCLSDLPGTLQTLTLRGMFYQKHDILPESVTELNLYGSIHVFKPFHTNLKTLRFSAKVRDFDVCCALLQPLSISFLDNRQSLVEINGEDIENLYCQLRQHKSLHRLLAPHLYLSQ